MRILLILRGNYHAGQEEFVHHNHLKNFTLDINDLRSLTGCANPLPNHQKSLNYKYDNELYKLMLDFLQMRMKRGEFCVINAYNEHLKTYKDLANLYRYKMFVIEFNANLEQCMANNLKQASSTGYLTPFYLLENTANSLKKIPKKYEVLSPNNWQQILYEMPNLSAYKKIHHIGDIQGCYSVLKKYLKSMKDDEYYIFLGDYINRGIENGKVLKFLLKICEKENVCLLEGNHERHLIKWANGEVSTSKEFNENTLKDFYKEKLNPKDAKKLYPFFKECLFYKYGRKKILCSHAGLNFAPKKYQDLSFVSSYHLINGIDGYEDSQAIAEEFCKNSAENVFEVFGHRNKAKLPMQIASRVFLCEGKVDAGGYLRVLTLNKDGFKCIEVKNEVYRK
ncbi:metallophosphoesterase [Campylobacter sp. US33a]|uniref:metallophosphoesterase n=1 Tax=Campylobacter sp. US33a TaxID=2498120 RepID=UPI001067407F|nr:metallophosphoesterase [Campylobacter sp. US33a]TEY02006.1 serine/threonine protein phosphatase [Campylobacter sp. US33a]